MKPPAASKTVAAFSLVEVALALGIAAFCLVSVIGLVPIGVDTENVASDQATASNILTYVLADLRATPSTLNTTAICNLPIPSNTGSPTSTVLYFGNAAQPFYFPSQQSQQQQLSATSRFRVTVRLFPPPNGGRAATLATLLVTWPAQVDPTTGVPAGRVQFCTALDRN